MSDSDLFRRTLRPGSADIESAALSGSDDEARDRLMRYFYSEEFASLTPAVREAVRGALAPTMDPSRFGLEALVRLTGRPALEIVRDFINVRHPEAASWGHLQGFREPIERLARSVGRIELNGVHVGTGVVIALGAILTNRHVLEEVAKAFPATDGGEVWLLSAGELCINFDGEIGTRSSKRFPITGVIATGEQPINRRIDLARVDAAILSTETVNRQADAWPAPVVFARPGTEAVTGPVEIISIGYPGSARFSPAGPVMTEEEVQIDKALKRVFNYTPGVKRLSPGLVVEPAGTIDADPRGAIFTHDASTLEGASGSVIASLSGEDLLVVGIHFGGRTLDRNFGLTGASLESTLFIRQAVTWSPEP